MQELKETVYEHAAGNKTFTVTAEERWSIAMIMRLKKKYPDEVEIVHTNADGSLVAHIPLSAMKIKFKKRVSDEQREAARVRMQNMWSSDREMDDDTED